MTFPTKFPSGNLGRIGKTRDIDYNSLFLMALRGSPWDSLDRWPSHLDKRRAWRHALLAEENRAALHPEVTDKEVRPPPSSRSIWPRNCRGTHGKTIFRINCSLRGRRKCKLERIK